MKQSFVLMQALLAKRTLYSLSVFSNENTPFMRFTHSSTVRTLAIVFAPVRSMNSPCLQAEAIKPAKVYKVLNPKRFPNAGYAGKLDFTPERFYKTLNQSLAPTPACPAS